MSNQCCVCEPLGVGLALSLVLCPMAALGQTPSAPWGTAPSAVGSGSAFVSATPDALVVSRPPTFWQRTGRVFAELLGAGLGVGVSAVLGVGSGCALDHGRCRSENIATSGAVFGVFGVPAGVSLAGGLLGARGGYGWSVLGELAGALLAVPIAILLQRRPGVAAAAAIVLPVAGAVVGFEVSADQPPAPRGGSARWMPALNAGSEGVMVGAVGVF